MADRLRYGPKPAERLNRAMDQRRQELGLRWIDVANRAHLSEEVIRKIRNGWRSRVRTTLTEAKIERALQWEPGSLNAIRAGGNPTPSQVFRQSAELIGDPTYRALWKIEGLSMAERELLVLILKLMRSRNDRP